MKLKIYTRTGDKGTTSLYGGRRVEKFDPKVVAYGTVDELNSAIGVVIAHLEKGQEDIRLFLTQIQADLFTMGAHLAGSRQILDSIGKRVSQIENFIDTLDKELPTLKNFIFPAGVKSAAFTHLARSICRRAERKVVRLSYDEHVDTKVIMYLNRLSDFLFVLARYLNHIGKGTEAIWKKI